MFSFHEFISLLLQMNLRTKIYQYGGLSFGVAAGVIAAETCILSITFYNPAYLPKV